LEGPAFALLLLECSAGDCHAVLERLHDRVNGSSFQWEGLDFKLRYSTGIASVPEDVKQPGELLAAAERALRRREPAAEL
jgi:GGDEF domain-containing protein